MVANFNTTVIYCSISTPEKASVAVNYRIFFIAFYCGNLLPFHGTAAIMCYKTISPR